MLAIHNKQIDALTKGRVANAFAKLSKCQQFTTAHPLILYKYTLQTLLQSYQNVSNSQPSKCIFSNLNSCKRFCKVIKMLAIHNYTLLKKHLKCVANAFAKLSKCQQFTTILILLKLFLLLQTLLQSYQNVSNSQLHSSKKTSKMCCKRFCKVIKMLAIHNQRFEAHRISIVANAFAKLSKCQQFTTIIISPSEA